MWIIMSLRMESRFQELSEIFWNGAGEEYRFFTWGNQDVMELQRNMKYYNLLKLMPGPVTLIIDVQKLFSVKFRAMGSPDVLWNMPLTILIFQRTGIFTGHWQMPAIRQGFFWRLTKPA